MRTPTIALALLAGLAACGEAPASDPAAGVARPIGGPEAIVVRVAAGGGPVRAYRYPTLDAPIWASRAPLPAGVTQLGFDADNGTLLVLDRSRRPWRVTLGMGTVSLAGDVPLTFAHQTDGTDVVGVADGTLLRFTTTDVEPWRAR
ncbi:MAG: hypothetical protein MUF21_02950, partial [Gemmatimonadaceae bacterium]|nr:hypothetical protein [Gemmatimonadaceae bacterium]